MIDWSLFEKIYAMKIKVVKHARINMLDYQYERFEN